MVLQSAIFSTPGISTPGELEKYSTVGIEPTTFGILAHKYTTPTQKNKIIL
jgi:hypothetical protein